MCILMIKEKNKVIPSKETLETCFESNPDGAGFTYNKNGMLYIKKGFMDFDSFYKEVVKIPVESSALIHCRIGTSGGKTPEMTHPYPLSNDFKIMKKTNIILKCPEGQKAYAVAHNGIFSGLGYATDVNDTCLFIANILKPLRDRVKNIQDKELEPVINRLVDTSRLAIIDNEGNITKYGSGWIEDGGIWYSNNTYKKIKYTYYNYRGGYNYSNSKNWYDLICDKYGNYRNYQDAKRDDENIDIKLLKEKYPEFSKDIDCYAKQGLTAWQINSWIQSDLMGDWDY